MKKLVSQVLAFVQKQWAKEPARIISGVVAVVVFGAAKLGIVLPHESVAAAVGFVLPILLGGELIRSQVTPTGTVAPAPAPVPKV